MDATLKRRRTSPKDSVASAAAALPKTSVIGTSRSRKAVPAPRPERRIYVLDTSVLLADPGALARFDEHEVVIPLVVITELEGKRHHPELGWSAREALRRLEELRVRTGSVVEPAVVNDKGGTLRIELNHIELSGLPAALRAESNDHRILAVAHNLVQERPDREVVVVTKDLPLRLKTAVCGLAADEYRNELAVDTGWTGMVELAAEPAVIDALYHERLIDPADVTETSALPLQTGVVLSTGSQSAIARLHADHKLHLLRQDQEVFGVKGRSAEQRLAIDLLLDDSVGIVSLGGKAGTGKSMLAIAAGLEAVLERRSHRRIMVFRSVFAVGGQDLGFLPGSEAEKMSPWAAAVYDALDAICSENVIEEVVERDLLEVLPLTHIRGRTLTDAWVVIDEAQNLERMTLLTALSRIGEGSRVVLTHDVAQRDNLRVGRHDGVISMIERLKGNALFGHVTLQRTERSAIAGLVASVLDDITA